MNFRDGQVEANIYTHGFTVLIDIRLPQSLVTENGQRDRARFPREIVVCPRLHCRQVP